MWTARDREERRGEREKKSTSFPKKKKLNKHKNTWPGIKNCVTNQ